METACLKSHHRRYVDDTRGYSYFRVYRDVNYGKLLVKPNETKVFRFFIWNVYGKVGNGTLEFREQKRPV